MEDGAQYRMSYKGFLKGHNGWVTCMKSGSEKQPDGSTKEFLLTGARDRSLIVWDLQDVSDADGSKEHGKPKKVMKGHSHFISDIDLSSDSRFALSSSWDGTIRLWNLAVGETRKTLFGHTKDVMTVAFSPDNRQIASGSIDKQIKIWNIQGVCKFTVEQNQHTDWVSCVRFYYDMKRPIVISASWDRTIKVWDNTTMSLMHTFVGHKAQVNCLDIASGTTFLASGGRDGKVNVWNLVDGKHLDECDAESPVNCVIFASRVLWVIIGTEEGIRVYHLPSKKFIDKFTADDLDGKQRRSAKIGCTSLCFSKENNNCLYAGFTDGYIRVLNITPISE
jgi:guanine nucleotide-binding protein subunit beta-2-like 1 protein